MTGMDRLTVPIEWKASADDSGTLEGYASTFGNIDFGYDVVVEGAFLKTIARIKSEGIPLLADHVASVASVLGTIYDAAEDSKGLKIKARFSSAPSAQDVRTKLVEGHLGKLSIGYEATKYAYEEREGKTVRLLQEIKLWETSVVVLPMNEEAVTTRVKSLAGMLTADARKALAADIAEASIDEAEGLTQDNPGDRGVQSSDELGGGGPDEGSQQAGDDPADGASDEGAHWDRWASEALLADNDPDATADPADVAGLRTLLELNETALGLGSADTESE
jgi:HK97 family phage prohead protease